MISRYKFLLQIFIVSSLVFSFAHADSEKTYELKDINVELIVSIEGMDIPDQILKKNKKESLAENMNWILSPFTKPVPLKIGKHYKLKVEIIEEGEVKKDITNDKNIKFNSSKPYAFYISPAAELIAKPDPSWSSKSNITSPGSGSVRVEYISDSGKIGFGGFNVDVQP